MAPSSYYFQQVINNNSPYKYDSLVRLGFIAIRLDDIKQLNIKV